VITRAPGAPDSLFLFGTRAHPNGTTSALTIKVEFGGARAYALGPHQVDQYELIGGDGIIGSYAGSRPHPGELDITAYDERVGVVQGTVRFWLTPSSTGTPPSGPLEFTAGQFRVPVTVGLRQ
jgi:hypothetical protein